MSKITDYARGQQCQIRIPGVCNRDPKTVVACHLGGGGMGTKHPDSEVAFGCSACHDVVDGRVKYSFPLYGMLGRRERDWVNQAAIKIMFHEGAVRTRKILIDAGLLVLK